jgi:NAD(P)-dependent dehydrogenase (short-subunit alcohol dehydrogenase family)
MSSAIYPSLRGKRVVITGGASGIGAGFVRAFVRQGAEVLFLDVADAEAEALAGELHAADILPRYHHCDLTDLASVARTFADIGAIDILVNNAANDDRHPLESITPAYWDERMNVNLRHMLFCTQAVVDGMKARGGGVVVNMGSMSWHLGMANLVLYQTAKAAIEGMTRGLARELGPDNIRVTSIVPGNIRTPRQQQWYTPEGEAEIMRLQCLNLRLEPRDVAALVLFLASDDARGCTGHDYWIDAGWGMT